MAALLEAAHGPAQQRGSHVSEYPSRARAYRKRRPWRLHDAASPVQKAVTPVVASLLLAAVAPLSAADAIPDASSDHAFKLGLYDAVTVIGFSREGLFAYAIVGCGDESGAACFNAVVQDLRDDRIVATIGASESDSESLIAYGAKLQQMLGQYGIEARGTRRDPSFVAEQRFCVETATWPPPPTAQDIDAVPRTTRVMLVREAGRTKRVGTIHETGPLDFAAPRPLAVFVSPFARLVAILVADDVYGGCGGARTNVSVFGADLDERFPQ